jgi:hypothetical protein
MKKPTTTATEWNDRKRTDSHGTFLQLRLRTVMHAKGRRRTEKNDIGNSKSAATNLLLPIGEARLTD